jgi:hypothetical protein
LLNIITIGLDRNYNNLQGSSEGIYHVLSVTIKIDMVLITLYKLNMKTAIIDTFQKPMNHRKFSSLYTTDKGFYN